jgi:hypothetical protein
MKKKYDIYSLKFNKKGEENPRPLGDLDFAEVVQMLSLHWSQAPGYHLGIRQMALDEIVEHRGDKKLEDFPLKKDAVLTIIGDSVFKVKELKERLAAFDIKIAPRLTNKTTHILLGLNPSTTKGLEDFDGELCFLKDRHLQAVLDELEQPYLQEDDEQTVQSVENIADLLMSGTKDNINLAIQIIEGGGFPTELIPHAFIAMKIARDSDIYQSIKKILDKYLPASAKKSIRRTLSLYTNMREKSLTKNLRKYTERVDGLDGIEIAKIFFQYYKKGVQFIWKYSKDSALNKEILEHYIQGKTLDLSGLGLTILPKEIEDYPEITKVNLRNNEFASIPKQLLSLPNLEWLDVSANYYLGGVSPHLTKMKKLKFLDLRGHLMYWDSPHLLKLTQLETLVLKDISAYYHRGNEQKIKKRIKEALPDCEIKYV